MSRWGDEKTVKFIRLYREYECLWNSSSSLYKNKIARDNAYIKIQEGMNDMTVKDIKNKIKGLRSTYHQEVNKIKSSKRSGAGTNDVYKPSLSWFEEMEFLNDTLEYRKSNSTQLQQPSSETISETHEQHHSFSQTSTEAPEQPQAQTSTEALQQPRSSSNTPLNSNELPHAVTKKTFQNRKRHAEPNETLTALQRLENITHAINNPRSTEDEFYYFGQSVAAQLRALPLNSALDMQAKIQALLSTERTRLYQYQSPSTSYSQPSTPYSQTSHSQETSGNVTYSSFNYQTLSHANELDTSSDALDNTVSIFQSVSQTERNSNILNTAWENS